MELSYHDITSRIKHAINSIDPSADIYLFGSRARGNAKDDSDWDILILVDKEVDSIRTQAPYRKKILEVMTETGQVISTIIRNKRKWFDIHKQAPLFYEINKEGVIL